MSTFDSDDLERTGYFLPEDSQFRLKKLREYLEFLSHLAQPRIADTDDTEPEPAGPAMDEAGKSYVSGVTLEQIDELARLGDILRAHGDVVVATDQADFADVTLTIMGDAILRDAERLRDIIHAIDSMQRLDGQRRSHADVQEEAATYLAVPAGMQAPARHAAPLDPAHCCWAAWRRWKSTSAGLCRVWRLRQIRRPDAPRMRRARSVGSIRWERNSPGAAPRTPTRLVHRSIARTAP